MTVLTRSKPGAALLRRSREARSDRAAEPSEQAPAERPDRDLDAAPLVSQGVPSLLRRRRQAIAPQDLAMYSCQCGFQFEAPVSTSVGCPHCGDPQAW